MDATLIYPHQLFKSHPAIAKGQDIYLIEDPLFFGNDPRWPTAMHQQKLMLHRASMQAYAAELKAAGHHAYQIEVPDGSSLDSADLLDRALPAAIREIHLADPADEILMSGVSVGGPFEVTSTTD